MCSSALGHRQGSIAETQVRFAMVLDNLKLMDSDGNSVQRHLENKNLKMLIITDSVVNKSIWRPGKGTFDN